MISVSFNKLSRGIHSLAPSRDCRAVQVSLDTNALHVNARGAQIRMVERVLRRCHRAGLFSHDAPEGVPGLVQMNMLNSGFFGIELQVSHEGV